MLSIRKSHFAPRQLIRGAVLPNASQCGSDGPMSTEKTKIRILCALSTFYRKMHLLFSLANEQSTVTWSFFLFGNIRSARSRFFGRRLGTGPEAVSFNPSIKSPNPDQKSGKQSEGFHGFFSTLDQRIEVFGDDIARNVTFDAAIPATGDR